jgi:putative protease
MNKDPSKINIPSILAPAGSKASFLAALAAGADAVYCGLKQFSARMEAPNFTLEELRRLTHLAHDKGTKVYVTLNSLLKPEDLDRAGRLLDQLNRWVKPDALIIQDLALVQLARQTGFTGGLHLSTLANLSFPIALKLVHKNLGVDHVVLPRDLDIDEIKAMAHACPESLGLEVFVHGALCYGVSGRCYWSSFLGGKSGLRGRCVQPCRRNYAQSGQRRRFFACQDLSLDVLVKILLPIPNVRTWKIEGRKKGPHYIFCTVKAYRMLRDQGRDPQIKKAAVDLLSQAMGRTGTHYRFLPQRPQVPVGGESQTASGRFVGKVMGLRPKPYLVPREALFPGDVLRVGFEDESWHTLNKVNRYIPPKGHFNIKASPRGSPRKGTPVFLVDRREKKLEESLSRIDRDLSRVAEFKVPASTFNARRLKKSKKKFLPFDLYVYRRPFRPGRRKPAGEAGLWLSDEVPSELIRSAAPRQWWWLPPVIWPGSEINIKSQVDHILKRGGRNFVLNAPWQVAFFELPKSANLWAGPFCNLTNTLAISVLESLGFSGVIISPELGNQDYLLLPRQSPLPLGIVISGNWPLCVSRIVFEDLKLNEPFSSPKGEQAWVKKYGSDYWIYPNWNLDIKDKKASLQVAGYKLFVHLIEPVPRSVKLKARPGLWNWNINLL